MKASCEEVLMLQTDPERRQLDKGEKLEFRQ